MSLTLRHLASCTRLFLQERHISMAKLGATIPPPIQVPAHFSVKLTEEEHNLFGLLNECVIHLKNEKDVYTTCRIAGGWVRDKLLGSDSNDIDIALTNMMGRPFAEYLKEFATLKGIPTSDIVVVEKNAEQSKHLETAKLKLLGIDLDLVNLRSEEYALSSRIPTLVMFGTPLQDAIRRDVTMNSLFYNVHTREVEDFTEQGLSDLRQGIIRTPLAPRETFLDDPLRALRCIRFASRLGFKLVPDLAECLQQAEIQQALVSKVSRERVGDEVLKMMSGRSPLHALNLIYNARLYQSIFCVYPQNIAEKLSNKIAGDTTSAIQFIAVLQALLTSDAASALPVIHPLIFSAVRDDPTCKTRLYMAATLSPFLDATYTDRKGKSVAAVGAALRESLKLGAQYHLLDGIPLLFNASNLLKSSGLLTGERFAVMPERVAIATLLRHKSVHGVHKGLHWTSSLLFSMARELSALYDPVSDTIDLERAADIIERCNAFVKRVEELDLININDVTVLIDGGRMQELLKAGRGPWLSRALEQVLEWQFEHPHGTTSECEAWIVEQHRIGKIDTIALQTEPARKRLRKT